MVLGSGRIHGIVGLRKRPAGGRLSYWGNKEVTTTYNPTTDDGLWNLGYKKNWNNTELESMLENRGYVESEVKALMKRSHDSSGAYQYRTAVALGLADWNSGHPGGRWETSGADAGNGNNWVSSGEMEWTHDYPFSGSGGSIRRRLC